MRAAMGSTTLTVQTCAAGPPLGGRPLDAGRPSCVNNPCCRSHRGTPQAQKGAGGRAALAGLRARASRPSELAIEHPAIRGMPVVSSGGPPRHMQPHTLPGPQAAARIIHLHEVLTAALMRSLLRPPLVSLLPPPPPLPPAGISRSGRSFSLARRQLPGWLTLLLRSSMSASCGPSTMPWMLAPGR